MKQLTRVDKMLLSTPRRSGDRLTARLALVIVLAVFSCLWPGGAAAATEEPSTSRFPAWLETCALPGAPEDALCGTYHVAEDRASAGGRRIGLFMVVLPASDPGRLEAPIFPLAGGPGQAASEAAAFAGAEFGALRGSRDVVLLDQRGTGRSNPLRCETPSADSTLQERLSDFRTGEFARRCLEQQTADVTLYTTDDAVADLDEVRQALGYGRINLFGGSYGTRVALHYVRRYPQWVRAVVIDGVSPPYSKQVTPSARAFERTLGHVFERCARDPVCSGTYSDLEAAWSKALARFSDGSLETLATHPDSGEMEQVVVSRGQFADGVRHLLYSAQGWSDAAHVIHAAAQGDFDPFVSSEVRSQSGIHRMSLGMLFTISCSERVPFVDNAQVTLASSGTSLGDYRVRRIQEACLEWKAGSVPADWMTPVRSDAAILLVSGEIDPATPFEEAVEVARHLPNSLHLVIPNRSHMPTESECEREVTQAFLRAGTVEGLDTSCAEETAWPAFRVARAQAPAVTLGREQLAAYVGKYELQPGFALTVGLEGDRLIITLPGGAERSELVPESATTFFVKALGERITFEPDENGVVSRVVIENGPTARRIEEVPSSMAETSAPEATPPAVTLESTEVRPLRSQIVDQEFRLLVALPFGPPQDPGGRYPVLYLLDADISFPLVRQVADSLQNGFELPPVLIVGVGYAGGFGEGMMRRNRDYTPTPDPVFMKFNERWGGGPAAEGGSGGAANFLRFVREELKPFIEANYPADPSDATVVGVSFGGLFAAYAMLQHPDTFQRYIIGSPSLWWDNRVVFDYEKSYAEQHDDLDARVFVAAGGRETAEHDEAQLARVPEDMRKPMLEFQEAMGGGVQMVELIEPFIEKLNSRAYPSLDLTLHIFPDETHGSVPPMTISRGLRVVFDTF